MDVRVALYVMRRPIVLGAFVLCCSLLLAGCGSGSSSSQSSTEAGTSTGSTQTAAKNAQAVVSVDEIGLGANGYVTLLNFTDQPQRLRGLRLCQEKKCADLPDVTVKPGARARVATGQGKGISSVVMTDAGLGELKTSNGEVALFAKNDEGDRQLVTFLEWGSTPHEHTSEAIADGLWAKGSYAPTAPTAVRLYQKSGGLWVFATQ